MVLSVNISGYSCLQSRVTIMFYELPPTAAPIRFGDYLKSLFSNKKRSREELTSHLKEYLNVRNAYFISSGRAALTLILKVLSNLSDENKNEIVMPAYTCYSVAASISKADKHIVLCDIKRDRYDYDLDKLGDAISDNTLAIVVPHFCGIEANIKL